VKATTPLTEVAASESGRGHRLRKAPATKEIVPLTDLSRKTPEWLQLAYEFVTDKTAGPAAVSNHYTSAAPTAYLPS
jgi:hypothetical protein